MLKIGMDLSRAVRFTNIMSTFRASHFTHWTKLPCAHSIAPLAFHSLTMLADLINHRFIDSLFLVNITSSHWTFYNLWH
jgi:hypothetical protein